MSDRQVPKDCQSSSVTTSAASAVRDYRFAPAVGRWQIEMARLTRLLGTDIERAHEGLAERLSEFDDLVQDPASGCASLDRLRFAFSLSLLADILGVGGQIRVIDSEIYVSWPNWDAAEGRLAAERALRSVLDLQSPIGTDWARLGPLFSAKVDAETLARFLAEGRFWLEPVSETHPSGIGYGEAFSFGLRLWTMPYRGREGRLRRFVVLGEHRDTCRSPVVVGLIEVGDDGPFSTERDELLCLRPEVFCRWFLTQPDRGSLAGVVAERMRAFRSAIRPVPGVDTLEPAEVILKAESDLVRRSGGRSRTDEDLDVKKRIAYLVRLAHGELAFNRLAQDNSPEADDLSLREGVRAIHDLIVPRVHMEVTVCGALPPFAAALGGKLVVAFLSHPNIVDSTIGEPGLIHRQVFDAERTAALLPNWGILALTTKGLYPGHSALYNRAEIAGLSRPAKLRKIGETRGTTTTLLSYRTTRLAERLVGEGAAGSRVSRRYGTGGAKRQRILESAVVSSGLPMALVHAGIRRPVYGVRLVENLERIIWAGDTPKWRIQREAGAEEHADGAVSTWRQRWLERALERLGRSAGPVAGVFDEAD